MSLPHAHADPNPEAPERILPSESAPEDADREPIHASTEGLLVVPRQQDVAKDPRAGAGFAASVHVYLSENGTMVRRFVVHAPDRDTLPIAKRCGRMLACLWSAANSRFGRTSRGLRGAAVHAWMTRSGEAGGEQVRNNLYFYDIFGSRTGLEWTREIAHEYGHYLLAAPSGYTQPESWANGVLGERLFIKWIIEDAQAPTPGADPFPFATNAELADYRAKQIEPLLARVRVDGPDLVSLPKTDRDAFDNFTALMLYVDDTYGSRILTDLLDYLPSNGKRAIRGDDFLSALMLRLDAAAKFETRLTSAAASLVYVPVGSFHVTASRQDIVFGKGLAVTKSTGGWTVRTTAPGWRSIQVRGGSNKVRLTWERAAPPAGQVAP